MFEIPKANAPQGAFATGASNLVFAPAASPRSDALQGASMNEEAAGVQLESEAPYAEPESDAPQGGSEEGEAKSVKLEAGT